MIWFHSQTLKCSRHYVPFLPQVRQQLNLLRAKQEEAERGVNLQTCSS